MSPTPTGTWMRRSATCGASSVRRPSNSAMVRARTKRGAYEIKHLVEKLAYDQWHRLLFARYLLGEQSPHLALSTASPCRWTIARNLRPRWDSRMPGPWRPAYAAKELTGDLPCRRSCGRGRAVLSRTANRSSQLVTGLPVEVFTASDSLGWCYQFWQAERKEEVNAAGNKIGADELPAVTQLFTEDYMVDFLLDNTLGRLARGQSARSESLKLAETATERRRTPPGRRAARLPVEVSPLHQRKDGRWMPAAGTFDGWPKHGERPQSALTRAWAAGISWWRCSSGWWPCAWPRKSWTKRSGGGRHPRQPVRLGD
jgi:hypothetical protein